MESRNRVMRMAGQNLLSSREAVSPLFHQSRNNKMVNDDALTSTPSEISPSVRLRTQSSSFEHRCDHYQLSTVPLEILSKITSYCALDDLYKLYGTNTKRLQKMMLEPGACSHLQLPHLNSKSPDIKLFHWIPIIICHQQWLDLARIKLHHLYAPSSSPATTTTQSSSSLCQDRGNKSKPSDVELFTSFVTNKISKPTSRRERDELFNQHGLSHDLMKIDSDVRGYWHLIVQQSLALIHARPLMTFVEHNRRIAQHRSKNRKTHHHQCSGCSACCALHYSGDKFPFHSVYGIMKTFPSGTASLSSDGRPPLQRDGDRSQSSRTHSVCVCSCHGENAIHLPDVVEIETHNAKKIRRCRPTNDVGGIDINGDREDVFEMILPYKNQHCYFSPSHLASECSFLHCKRGHVSCREHFVFTPYKSLDPNLCRPHPLLLQILLCTKSIDWNLVNSEVGETSWTRQQNHWDDVVMTTPEGIVSRDENIARCPSHDDDEDEFHSVYEMNSRERPPLTCFDNYMSFSGAGETSSTTTQPFSNTSSNPSSCPNFNSSPIWNYAMLHDMSVQAENLLLSCSTSYSLPELELFSGWSSSSLFPTKLNPSPCRCQFCVPDDSNYSVRPIGRSVGSTSYGNNHNNTNSRMNYFLNCPRIQNTIAALNFATDVLTSFAQRCTRALLISSYSPAKDHQYFSSSLSMSHALKSNVAPTTFVMYCNPFSSFRFACLSSLSMSTNNFIQYFLIPNLGSFDSQRNRNVFGHSTWNENSFYGGVPNFDSIVPNDLDFDNSIAREFFDEEDYTMKDWLFSGTDGGENILRSLFGDVKGYGSGNGGLRTKMTHSEIASMMHRKRHWQIIRNCMQHRIAQVMSLSTETIKNSHYNSGGGTYYHLPEEQVQKLFSIRRIWASFISSFLHVYDDMADYTLTGEHGSLNIGDCMALINLSALFPVLQSLSIVDSPSLQHRKYFTLSDHWLFSTASLYECKAKLLDCNDDERRGENNDDAATTKPNNVTLSFPFNLGDDDDGGEHYSITTAATSLKYPIAFRNTIHSGYHQSSPAIKSSSSSSYYRYFDDFGAIDYETFNFGLPHSLTSLTMSNLGVTDTFFMTAKDTNPNLTHISVHHVTATQHGVHRTLIKSSTSEHQTLSHGRNDAPFSNPFLNTRRSTSSKHFLLGNSDDEIAYSIAICDGFEHLLPNYCDFLRNCWETEPHNPEFCIDLNHWHDDNAEEVTPRSERLQKVSGLFFEPVDGEGDAEQSYEVVSSLGSEQINWFCNHLILLDKSTQHMRSSTRTMSFDGEKWISAHNQSVSALLLQRDLDLYSQLLRSDNNRVYGKSALKQHHRQNVAHRNPLFGSYGIAHLLKMQHHIPELKLQFITTHGYASNLNTAATNTSILNSRRLRLSDFRNNPILRSLLSSAKRDSRFFQSSSHTNSLTPLFTSPSSPSFDGLTRLSLSHAILPFNSSFATLIDKFLDNNNNNGRVVTEADNPFRWTSTICYIDPVLKLLPTSLEYFTLTPDRTFDNVSIDQSDSRLHLNNSTQRWIRGLAPPFGAVDFSSSSGAQGSQKPSLKRNASQYENLDQFPFELMNKALPLHQINTGSLFKLKRLKSTSSLSHLKRLKLFDASCILEEFNDLVVTPTFTSNDLLLFKRAAITSKHQADFMRKMRYSNRIESKIGYRTNLGFHNDGDDDGVSGEDEMDPSSAMDEIHYYLTDRCTMMDDDENNEEDSHSFVTYGDVESREEEGRLFVDDEEEEGEDQQPSESDEEEEEKDLLNANGHLDATRNHSGAIYVLSGDRASLIFGGERTTSACGSDEVAAVDCYNQRPPSYEPSLQSLIRTLTIGTGNFESTVTLILRILYIKYAAPPPPPSSFHSVESEKMRLFIATTLNYSSNRPADNHQCRCCDASKLKSIVEFVASVSSSHVESDIPTSLLENLECLLTIRLTSFDKMIECLPKSLEYFTMDCYGAFDKLIGSDNGDLLLNGSSSQHVYCKYSLVDSIFAFSQRCNLPSKLGILTMSLMSSSFTLWDTTK